MVKPTSQWTNIYIIILNVEHACHKNQSSVHIYYATVAKEEVLYLNVLNMEITVLQYVCGIYINHSVVTSFVICSKLSTQLLYNVVLLIDIVWISKEIMK